jgi:hypothetical protein
MPFGFGSPVKSGPPALVRRVSSGKGLSKKLVDVDVMNTSSGPVLRFAGAVAGGGVGVVVGGAGWVEGGGVVDGGSVVPPLPPEEP